MKRVIVFVALLWAASITLNAQASTGQDALKVAWYLKGEGDLILPQMGLTVTGLTCAPTKTKFVACKLRSVGAKTLCSTGRFYIKDYAAVGQWSKPRPCITS